MRILDQGRRANETGEECRNMTSSTTCKHRFNGARQQERRPNETEEESKIRQDSNNCVQVNMTGQLMRQRTH